MCEATLMTCRDKSDEAGANNTRSFSMPHVFKIDAKNADTLEYLTNKIYRHRDIYISNIRLFALLFLYDWSSAIHLGKPSTSGHWCLGTEAPYPVDYYENLKNKGLLVTKEHNDIWQAKRRVVFSLNFAGESRDPSDEQIGVIETVVNVAKKVGQEFSVNFRNEEYAFNKQGVLLDDFERGKLKHIDDRFLDLVYSLDPLLDTRICTDDGKLSLVECARRHRAAFKQA